MKLIKGSFLCVLAATLMLSGCNGTSRKNESEESSSSTQSIPSSSEVSSVESSSVSSEVSSVSSEISSSSEVSSESSEISSESSELSSESTEISSESSSEISSSHIDDDDYFELGDDIAEVFDDFYVETDIDNPLPIHTERQAEYLAYDGKYDEIAENLYPDGSKHLSDPNAIHFEWEHFPSIDTEVKSYSFYWGKEPDLSDGYEIKGSKNLSMDVYNSYLGTNYFRIIARYTDGTIHASPIMSYEVEDTYPRNLKIDGMTNCRDMGGGRILEDGGKIKQGLIYRTSSTSSWAYGRGDVPDTITDSGKEELLKRLGCKTEINVNNSGSSVAGIEKYVQAYMYYDGGKHHLYRNAEPLKEVFHTLADPDNYPVFYHCRIGTDRTGLCAIMISGLLGVSENEIYQDYLFSNFGNIQEKRYIGEKAGRDNIMNYINDLKTFPGEKFQNKVYNFLLSIGVPAAELDSVIEILTDGQTAEGNDNSQVVVLADDFEADGTTLKTSTTHAHPKSYYTLGANQSVTASFEVETVGTATLVAYLGSTTNNSTKISAAIDAKVNGNDFPMTEATFADAGFGQGDGRTYYSPVMLGEVYLQQGIHTVTITGKSNNLNIGCLSLIY